MNRKPQYLFILPIISILLISLGCASNYYVTAYNLQQRGNYIGAIENYDQFVTRSKDGALVTIALNNRSRAYYQLGVQSMERGNYQLAVRMFYLANTPEADEKMVSCYLALIDNANVVDELQSTLRLYDFIINAFPDIPAISDVIYRRLLIIHEYQPDHNAVWSNYALLVEHDAEGSYVSNALPIIDSYLPQLLDDARNHSETETIIEHLSGLLKYPHSYHTEIKNEIGYLYLSEADQYRNNEQFQEAEQYYSLAVEYNPSLQVEITERLNQTISQMIIYGDNLLREQRIDAAIEIYTQTFNIISDNPAALSAIARANEMKENIAQANILYNRALELEQERNYADAMRLYRQSYARDRQTRTAEKISLMTNLIELADNPEAFARKIITEYRNGIITRNLNNIIADLREKHGDAVNVSGWRIMLSTGTYRYEIRYDITSRTESYYFIWHVNLLTKQLTPLNRISTNIMEP